MGVIPRNENKREEMNEVMEILQSYCPRSGKSDDEFKKVLLGGDQLTVERCRGSQDALIPCGMHCRGLCRLLLIGMQK